MSGRSRLKIRLARALRHMTPAHAVRTRLAKKTIQNFADQVGMVYFGYADQHGDDHRLVRGHTVSYTHVDNHVCVGSVRGYDATMLIRNDVVQLQPPVAGKKPKQQRCHWLIATVDLHTKRTVPHIYIGLRQHDEVYKSSYSRLRPLEIGNLAAYTPQFLGKYTIYGKMTHALEIERLISPQIASVITSHFNKISIEIERNTVYLYSENEQPNEVQLERILSNALWLAEAIDTAYGEAAN